MRYEYDAWGNTIFVKDENGNAITSATHIGSLNPFRYRGYYYDTESGLYYLMSRYYDPVTHRFINSDGYFQAGGGILDANMCAYCGNNPISRADSTGSCYVDKFTTAGTYIGTHWVIKTAIPGVPGFCNDCGSYTPNSRNNINSCNSLKKEETSVWQKIGDSIGAVFWSLEVDADVGFGFGGSTNMGIFELTGLAKWSPLSFHFDEQNIFLGMEAVADVGASMAGVDLISWDCSNYYNYLSGQEEENIGESHIVGISAGAYFIVGASAGFGWNLDYITNRWVEIWS